MSADYIKHLIDCHCILSIYKNRTKPVYHKFTVFSELKEDNIKEKYVLCNNCDIVHKIIDVNKSEIKWGSEGYRSLVTTREDIKFNLESQGLDRLVTILEVNNIDLSDWEYVEYLLENKLEGKVVLDKKEIENSINYKYVEIKNGKYKIKNDIAQRYL